MKPSELLLQFRREIQDEARPYLWSDDDIYAYMADAQEQFCRKGGGIADSTSEVTEIQAIEGEEFASIDCRILKIRQAKLSDGTVLELLNFENLERGWRGNDYGVDTLFKLDDTEGDIKALVEGMEQDKVRLLYIPDEDQIIYLVVYRLPLKSPGTANDVFEIHSQHHLHLLDWMKHLAYLKQDADTYDRAKSEEFEARFLRYCEEAMRERTKREHTYRSTTYGGI